MGYERLDKKAIKSWRVGRGLTLLILFILYAAVFVAQNRFDLPSKIYYIAIILFSLLIVYKIIGIIFFPIIEYKQWKYRITDDSVEICHGIFFIDRVIIPIIRIQNISISQGPINRKFGLYKIEISLASGSFKLEGLTKDISDEISENLKNKLFARLQKKEVM